MGTGLQGSSGKFLGRGGRTESCLEKNTGIKVAGSQGSRLKSILFRQGLGGPVLRGHGVAQEGGPFLYKGMRKFWSKKFRRRCKRRSTLPALFSTVERLVESILMAMFLPELVCP